MSLGTFLLGAVVACIVTSRCSGAFCDEGSPGRFCLSDLSGYYDCAVDPQTKTIKQVIKKCPYGTRCICMGVPCQTSNPCGTYKQTPIMPDSYHYEYNEELTMCSPAGCKTTKSRFAVWRDYKNLTLREERTTGGRHPSYEYFITVPCGRGSMLKFHIIPSRQSCTRKLVTAGTLPPKVQVPTNFKFNGSKNVYGVYCKRWVWKSGARYSSMPISVEEYDTATKNDGTPIIVHYSANFPGSEMTKIDTRITRYYYTFAPGVPDQNVFQLPKYCHYSQ